MIVGDCFSWIGNEKQNTPQNIICMLKLFKKNAPEKWLFCYPLSIYGSSDSFITFYRSTSPKHPRSATLDGTPFVVNDFTFATETANVGFYKTRANVNQVNSLFKLPYKYIWTWMVWKHSLWSHFNWPLNELMHDIWKTTWNKPPNYKCELISSRFIHYMEIFATGQ